MEYWDFILSIRFDTLNYFFKGVTFFANWNFLLFFPPLMYLCWKKKEGAHIILLLTVAMYFSPLFKELFAYARPPEELRLIEIHGYSFPSGHAVGATVLWGYLAYLSKKKWQASLLVTMIILVAISRVYLGVHYLRDIVAGLLLGTVCLFSYVWIVKKYGPRLNKLSILSKILLFILSGLFMFIVHRSEHIAISSALFAGVGCGYVLEEKFISFNPKTVWYKQLLKIIVSFIIMYGYYFGTMWTFDIGPYLIWPAYFVFGILFMLILPWLITKLSQKQCQSSNVIR